MDAKLYDELWQVEQDHWWFRARRQIVLSLIHRYTGDLNGRRLQICELGCGTGGNLAALAKDHDVVGIECSPHALEYARQRLGNRVYRGSLPDGVDLPPASFDVVLLMDVLEHIQDDVRSAATALDLLRPGGIVVATVPAYQWLYSPRDAHHQHFRRYGKRQFGDLWKSANSQVELLSHYNTLLFPPASLVRLASNLFAHRPQVGDLVVPRSPLNRLLAAVMGSELSLLGRVPLPFGLSLIAVVRKHGATQLPASRNAA